MEEGEILLLDVRQTEYESNHIPGAISVPMDELTERISSCLKTKKSWLIVEGRIV